ncbi:hypothetical protein HZA96_07215 [Candidatus Woesearchaeota archaeon]|nr:hypothetical protein [Candidatus Woesearchaeota archaeon]
MIKKYIAVVIAALLSSLFTFITVSADTYYVSMNASLSKVVYGTNENITLSGTLNRGTIVSSNLSNHTTLANANITLNISYYNGTIISTYILNTSIDGKFSTKSEANPNSTALFAPNVTGSYLLILDYKDPNNSSWKQWLFFSVAQSTIDGITVYTDEATYLSSDPVTINIESWKKQNGNKVSQANITVNGTIRNSANSITATFDCVTNAAGSCVINKTASSTAGSYTVEVNNFSSSTTYSVVPFDIFVYTKDTTGEVFKNTFTRNNGASIEVQVSYNDSIPTGEYNFTGTINDVNGNTVKVINATTLNANNSYTNRFSFTLDSSFSNGYYTANVTVLKIGTSSTLTATTTFEVRSWTLFVDARQQASNIEYGWKSYINKTIYIDILPLDAGNGTVLTNVNTSSMSITIKNLYSTILNTSNATWNATCRKNGCYQAALQTPAVSGTYKQVVTVDYSGEVQTFEQILAVINEKLEATPSNENGELKELFGTNEFIYISLTSLNSSGSSVNITDAELKSITFYNGTIFTYTNVSFAAVNATNNVSEYGFNVSSQLLKIDTPKSGGPYFLEIYANNKTLYTTTSVIVNPYDICSFPKNTAGQVSSSATNYYISQFKTSDIIYLELIVKEASNPLGKPSSKNSTNSTYGKGVGCTINTTTQQAVNNATVTIDEVLNSDSGMKTSLNITSSVCQSDDTGGKYTCTIQQANNSWEPGRYLVRLKIDKNGVTDIDYGYFEAKAFYLYAYSTSWRNKPNQNLAFTVNMYEAGNNWWGSSTGLSGTVSIERVEYCGADGFWMSSCADISYNTTGLNSTTVTNGVGSLTLEVNRTPAKLWSTGRYQAILKATDSSGTTDYGKANFEIRLFEAWGNPISIPTSGGCNYKYSVGAKENISLYVRITNAGNWNDNGGTTLGGTTYINVKKILETSSWPPKEVVASSYNATNLTVSASSPQYWSGCNVSYILNISSPTGRWNDSGYFQVVLDINGTETGYAWYQIKAFNVYTEPTNANGTNYVYNTNGRSAVYFKVYTTKGEKYYQSYTADDYINTTIQDMVLRYWDSTTMQTKELNYPEDINVTVNTKTTLEINGTNVINVTKQSGNWQTGYYWGEVMLRDTENQTGRGYVYFNVQVFRVESTSTQYEVGATANITATLNIRDPDWYTNSLLAGNYSVSTVYENVWNGMSSIRITYNFTPNTIFNASTNITIVPNNTNNRWSVGSWGGYHYLNLIVRDTSDNSTQSGWLSFRTVPFRVTINSTANVGLTESPSIPITLQSPSDNATVIGNLTKIYSWGSTNGYYGQKLYNFSIGSCNSNTSSSCSINGSANVNVTTPSGGWEDGYIYLTLVFTDGSTIVESSANFRATQIYTGWWNAVDESNVWNYYKSFTENASMQLNVYDSNNNPAIVNITQIEYAEAPQNCWMDSCRTYVIANWTIRTGNVTCNKICYINVTTPGTWKRGEHLVRATVSGSAGTAVIKSGYFWVRDMTAPILNITTPLNNVTYTNSSFLFSATTNENANCYLTLLNYDTYKSWYCWLNTTGICASGAYSGSNYYYKYLSKDYYYLSKNNSGSGTSYYSSTGLTTGTTTHSYSFPIDMTTQDYGLQVYCYDEDWNNVNIQRAFKINITG